MTAVTVPSRPPKRILAVGPPPHSDGGAYISFGSLLGFLEAQPSLTASVHSLPVHRPLYQEDGTPGPVRHWSTLRALLRAMWQLPRHDAVLLFGTADFCFTYGLAFIWVAALLRKHCAMRLSGGRVRFASSRLPGFARSLCFVAAKPVRVVSIETKCAREDLPKTLRPKLVTVRGYRPGPAAARVPRASSGDRVRFAFVFRAAFAEKGERVLRAALAQLRPDGVSERAELHVYGRPLPGECDIDAVQTTLHGYLPNDRLRQALAGDDVLLFPSLYPFEGHPGAIMEAFMAGVPVVATDWPGPCEIVEHGVNGLIVPRGDADAFAAAVRRLVVDRALRERLAAGAAASAKHFDQARVLPELAAALGLLAPAERGSLSFT